MKKLLLPIAILGVFNAFGQTVDTTTYKPLTVVILKDPFQIKWNDTTKAVALSVLSFSDNLKDKATFQWSLLSTNGKVLQNGIIECNGYGYSNWDGGNKYPFTFVASKLGLTLK